MSTKAGVGFSEKPDSKAAGAEAAKKALEEAGVEAGAGKVQNAFLFITAKHNPAQFRDGARSVLGADTHLVGGFAGGSITRKSLGYDGYQSTVGVIASDTFKMDILVEKGLKELGEVEVGRRLAKQIKSRKYDGTPGIWYMYDSVKNFSPAGFDMNIGTFLVEGMTEVLGDWPPAFGAGMIGNIQFNPTFQFVNDEILQQSAIACVFHGPKFRLDTTIMHGCKPASDYHKITKADKNVVLEIDGKPALEMVGELLGPGSDKSWKDYPLFITLGVNKADKFGPYHEENYANRLCMAIDEKRKGLIMFEPDLTAGTEVQLMRRSTDFSYVAKKAEDLSKSLGGRKPFLGVYIDCMGRAAAYCGSDGEEGAEVQRVIGGMMPLLGMYTGVELGTVGRTRQQALDWSGVLGVLSEA